jgi:hypothetical protein
MEFLMLHVAALARLSTAEVIPTIEMRNIGSSLIVHMHHCGKRTKEAPESSAPSAMAGGIAGSKRDSFVLQRVWGGHDPNPLEKLLDVGN